VTAALGFLRRTNASIGIALTSMDVEIEDGGGGGEQCPIQYGGLPTDINRGQRVVNCIQCVQRCRVSKRVLVLGLGHGRWSGVNYKGTFIF